MSRNFPDTVLDQIEQAQAALRASIESSKRRFAEESERLMYRHRAGLGEDRPPNSAG